jgi:hypothetical protein
MRPAGRTHLEVKVLCTPGKRKYWPGMEATLLNNQYIPGNETSVINEPPYAQPHLRWCGRATEVIPPPTRSMAVCATSCICILHIN